MIHAVFTMGVCALGVPRVEWSASPIFMAGRPYNVSLCVTALEDGATVPGWLLTPAAFEIDGSALEERRELGSIELPAGARITHTVDLSPSLGERRSFRLSFAKEHSAGDPVEVLRLEPAPKDLQFMEMDASELAQYNVLLSTNQGDILLEFWPEVAPSHVKNFLDLAHSGFYGGTTFHRVINGFMIQGGDPTETGSGNGPRMLAAEFSDRPHVRGVLSMARRATPGRSGPEDPLKDTASCQFFVMQEENPTLNGNYSAFGQLVYGEDALDRIASTPCANTKPLDRQEILEAIVVMAPGS